MIKLLLLAISLPILGFSQYFTTTQTVGLSSSAAVVTVQQPVSLTRTVRFMGAYLASTVATTFVIERNGTAATATAGTVNAVNPGEGTAQCTSWTGSNVGTGTVVGNYQISAGGSAVIDLTKFIFNPSGIGQNLTFRTNSVTGTFSIVILWQEL